MSKKLVSVLMSVYNGDNPLFLRKSIESIVNQSYDNIEIILVGDGLTKLELIHEIEKLQQEYIIVLNYFPQDVNKGLAVCMNEALFLAKGDFMARMDADDIMHSQRVEKQLSYLNKHKEIDIVGSWIIEFNIDSGAKKLVSFPLTHDGMLKSFGKRNPVAHPSVLMRKEFFKKAGNYPIDTVTDEDTMLWLNAFLGGCKFANIEEPLTNMRVSDSFYGRRAGFSKAYSDLKNRLKVVSCLRLSGLNYLFAFARFVIQIIPSSTFTKFMYKNLR